MVIQPTFRDTISIFFRRKAAFFTAFLVVCALGAAYLLLAKPEYNSSASLVLRFDTGAVPRIDPNVGTAGAALQDEQAHRAVLNSDADILRSPDLARGVIDAIGLPTLYPHIASANLPAQRKQDTALQAFASSLVVNVGLESDVITVNFLARTPELAQRVVQTLLNEFYGQEATIYANPQLRFAQQESQKARGKLTDAQNALAHFKQSNDIADLPVQVQQLLSQRTDISSRLAAANAALLQAQQQENALKSLLATVPKVSVSSAVGQQYQAANSAEDELDRLRAQRQRMASTYLPSSPVLHQLNAQINSLQRAVHQRTREAHSLTDSAPNAVYQSIKTDYLRAQALARGAGEPVKVLQKELDEVNTRVNALENAENKYSDLTRAVQIQSDTYRALAIRDQEAQIEASRNAQNISAAVVIATPSVPDVPARPRKKLVAAVVIVLGGALGAALVLAMEAFDDRLRTPREVAHVLRLPVLATFGEDL